MSALEAYLNGIWYAPDRRPPLILLLLSRVYRWLIGIRQWLYRMGLRRSHGCGRPVVIVGNITVGGSGKTPLVLWLVDRVRGLGFRPGVISRGYRGAVGKGPHRVVEGDSPRLVGDEPLLIARRTGVPVAVGSNRVACARLLAPDVDLIISDDGLQHLAMQRHLEFAALDGSRGIGNGRLIPAGPLREPMDRLNRVDMVLRKGRDWALQGEDLVNLRDAERRIEPSALQGRERVHAVAGIARPAGFFGQLQPLIGRPLIEHPYPDHHAFSEDELAELAGECVVMTEKDAVKCAPFAGEDWWAFPVAADLDGQLTERIDALLRHILETGATWNDSSS